MEVCTPKPPTDFLALGDRVMLVCPQCQFENPSHHKFCQKCGYSLTQKSCGECGSTVSLNVLNCPECGARTGTVWLAVVSGLPVGGREGDTLERLENPTCSQELDRLDGAIAEIPAETPTQTDKIQAATAVESEPELTPDGISSPSENNLEADSVASQMAPQTGSEQIWGSEAFDASEIPEGDALGSELGDDSDDSVEFKSDIKSDIKSEIK